MLRFLNRKKNRKNKTVYQRVAEHKIDLVDKIFPVYINRIINGPFKDMSLIKSKAWNQSDYVAIILGEYEKELHKAIELQIENKPELVVNIGASDGYYAIGLKLKLPNSDVLAIDIDENSRIAVQKNCELNNCYVEFDSKFEWSNIDKRFLDYHKIFFIIDIEGAESNILKIPDSVLKKSSFIIETHDIFVPNITNNLTCHLSKTHSIEIINELGRDPNNFQILDNLSNFDKYLAVIELRGGKQLWIVANPK